MQIRVRRYVHRVFVAATLGVASLPAICQAQESSLAAHALTLPPDVTAAPSHSTTNDIVPAVEASDERHLSITQATDARPPRRIGVLLPLYASFAGLQMLDAHSTVHALRNGGVEGNPLMRDLSGRPAALFAVKAGVTASTIFLTEKLRPKHRVGAIALMVALDSFYAMVVVHNYRATR